MSGITLAQAAGLDENAFSDLLAPRCSPARRFPGFARLRQHEVDPRPGERHVIELSVGPKPVLELTLRTSDTSSVSQILYFRDVTLETEVARLKNEFLTTAAHELRTPMVSIYGYAELLLSRELDQVSRQQCLEVVYMQSKIMVSILNDLLDLARIDERRGRHFSFEAVDVLALIHAAANELTLPDGRVRPQLEPPQAPFAVLVDRTQTQKALVNVLVNAYKYSDRAGEVKITVLPPACTTEAPLIGICITDQGIGMTPDQLSRVFERFYRADSSGKILGTGLGMSLVHEIITLHGGRVELASQPGLGTAVTLWLPAYQGQAAMALNIDK